MTATSSRISQDPRHHSIMFLTKGAVPQRRFPSWSMAFGDLNLPNQHSLTGCSGFLNTPLTGKELADNPDRCEKLLLVFKRDNL